jgi:serine/threonine protein kinase
MSEDELIAGRYRVRKPLGHGGMARVVLAVDQELGGEVALKLIHPHLAKSPQTIGRFKREVAVSRAVRHPGVIAVREFHSGDPDRDDDPAFLTMEYLPGGDLETRILVEGALPFPEVERIALEALSALQAAHSAGIVHRDLKPRNMLFAADGSLRLADFGMARIASLPEAGSEAGVAGTLDYCPPEILRGQYSDGRADIYSLGVALFQAATGSLPFRDNSPYVSIAMRMSGPAPSCRALNPLLPRWFDAAICKALSPEPRDRHQTAAAFAQALEAGASSDSLPFPPAQEARPTQKIVCQRCGAAVSPSLSYCYACGVAVGSPRAAPRGEAPARVVVLGNGKPGDKLGIDERERCLRSVDRAGIDSSPLRKAIPRPPFVLVGSLSESSARTMASSLSEGGIPAIALSRSSPRQDKRRARSAVLRYVAALTPRIWLILLATSTGAFNSVFRNLGEGAVGGLFLLGLLFLLPPAILAGRSGKRFARIVDAKAAEGEPLLLRAAGELREPELKELSSSLALKADSLRERLRAPGLLSARDSSELEAALDSSSGPLCELFLRAQALATALSAPESRKDASAAREKERELDSIKATLLGCSAALDSLAIGLSSENLSEAKSQLAGLERDLDSALDLAEGFKRIGEDA